MKPVIKKTQNTSNLVKRSVVLYARRYLPSERRWSVECYTGWSNERTVRSNLGRQAARELATRFLSAE